MQSREASRLSVYRKLASQIDDPSVAAAVTDLCDGLDHLLALYERVRLRVELDYPRQCGWVNEWLTRQS